MRVCFARRFRHETRAAGLAAEVAEARAEQRALELEAGHARRREQEVRHELERSAADAAALRRGLAAHRDALGRARRHRDEQGEELRRAREELRASRAARRDSAEHFFRSNALHCHSYGPGPHSC